MWWSSCSDEVVFVLIYQHEDGVAKEQLGHQGQTAHVQTPR